MSADIDSLRPRSAAAVDDEGVLMSGSKRQRELARAKYERQQARRAHRVDKRKRNQRIIAAVVVTALVLGTTAWVVLTHQSGPVAEPAVSASPSVSVLPSAAASASAGASASAAASAPANPSASAALAALNCKDPGTPRTDVPSFSAAPTTGTASSITLATNCGDIVIAVDPKASKTVASEAFLAKSGFYDNTTCHRLTTQGIFVLQCGDPKGDGTGGPGYTVPDENLPKAGDNNYPAGTVAMANAGPGTGGSQFFIVYQDTSLPGDYTIWGNVTSGLDIVKNVAAVGTTAGSADGTPQQPVFIESATVQP
jgi:peptidyl-prolyl cis-trans isomerase B (cyclophilin B)